MKKILSSLILATLILSFQSCETSDGLKVGVLQKVSRKTFPCNFYEMEVAYEGGVATEQGGYSNVQQVEITAEAFDTLSAYVGEKVLFNYSDVGIAFCGREKKLTSIRLKNTPIVAYSDTVNYLPSGNIAAANQ